MSNVESAIENADSFWWAAASAALQHLADAGDPFTADDLRRDPISIPEPDNPARWGALFHSARRRGVITTQGYATSLTASRHKGSLRVWVGVDAMTTTKGMAT